MRNIIPVALMVISLSILAVNYAHAELTIYQVENNPPGGDSGHEWLTVINLGELDTFNGYVAQTTNGRIASYSIPSINLNTCEYHKITFPKQAIDNEGDTVKLLKNGVAIYQTPVIKDTKNNNYFWTNPNVETICNSQTISTAQTDDMIIIQRIQALEERADRTDDLINVLVENIALLQSEIRNITNIIMSIFDSLNSE